MITTIKLIHKETGSDTEFGYAQFPEEVQKVKAGWV